MATRAWRCLAIALGALGGLGSGSVHALAPAAGDAPAGDQARRAAVDDPAGDQAKRDAVDRAREAARRGDFAAALDHYQQALRLGPTAKLHFNVAVCHHQLMVGHAAGSPDYEAQRRAAVDAYNRYLEAAPDAADANEVAELVRALGGTPSPGPRAWTIERVEPDVVPDPPSLDESWDDAPAPAELDAPTPAPAPAPAGPPARPLVRGSMGAFVPLSLSNPQRLAQSDALRPLPTLGLGLRGTALLGPHRRVALGGELAAGTQPASARTRHRLGLGWVGVVIEGRHALRGGRFEIGGGGVVGLAWQRLVYTGDAPLRCATAKREASARAGLVVGSRLSFAALLGERRNHELSLRAGPGLLALAAGSVASQDATGASCAGEPSAFDAFGLPYGAALSVTLDIGYAARF